MRFIGHFFFFREMKMFQSAKYFCFQLKSIRIDTRSERRPYNSILKFKVKEVGSVIGQTAWIFFSMNCFAIFLCTPANRHCASFSTQSWTLFSSFNEKLLLLSFFSLLWSFAAQQLKRISCWKLNSVLQLFVTITKRIGGLMKKEKTISLNRFSNIIINKLLFNLENEKIDFFFCLCLSVCLFLLPLLLLPLWRLLLFRFNFKNCREIAFVVYLFICIYWPNIIDRHLICT